MDRLIRLALCSLCLSGCVSVNRGSRPMGSIIGQMEAPPQPGDWCRVTYPERQSRTGSTSSELTGRVTSVDEQEIHLSDVVEEARSRHATPVASQLPYFGRYFKNTGVGLEQVGERTVALDEFERLEIISEAEARHSTSPVAAPEKSVAQQLVSAVPGRR